VDGQSRTAEIDVPPGRFLDEAADFALHLRRGERKPLVSARRRHAERRRAAAADVSENRRGQRVEIMRPPAGHRVVRDPENTRQARLRLGPRRVGTQLDLEAPHTRSKRAHMQARQCGLQIADQDLNEPGTVLPFQRQLLVVNHHCIHETW
jgi:hypothetical protein